MKFSIYLLMDSGGNVRYVGITTLTPERRLKDHLKCASRESRKTYRDKWIRSLPEPPLIHCIETTDDPDRERYWIHFFRSNGARLTNLTDGGDGVSGYRHTPESKARMSAVGKWKKRSEETRQRISAAGKARSDEHRAKVAASLRGHVVSDEARQKISTTRKARYAAGAKNPMLGRKQSEESKRKNREAQLRRSAAGLVTHLKGKFVSEETRHKLRLAAQRRKERQLSCS